jgi:hypothetical protein
MPKSYSFFNRRENIFEPNITRQRIPFNGPISSERLNLYYDQMRLDLGRLGKNIQEIEATINDIKDLIENNLDLATPGYYLDENLLMTIYGQVITYDGTAEEYVIEGATPYYLDPLEYYSNAVNSSKITLLKSKLNDLEKKIS